MGSGFSAATNRTSTQSADANGNSTASGYTWDMENRLLSAVSGTFWAYDPHGKRVFTESWGTQQNPYTTCEVDFYGIGGRKLAAIPCQYDTNGVFSTGTPLYNVYFGGKLIRSKNVTVVTDRLGSVRGTSNDEVMRYTPYGTERTSTADGREKWGTYIRDAGTGNDYADQRYKGIGSAEFLSPDRIGLRAIQLQRPTSWNRYAYAWADPINHTDRHGTEVDDDGDGTDDSCTEDEDGPCFSVTGYGGTDDGGGGGDGSEDDGGDPCDLDPISCVGDPTPGPVPVPVPSPAKKKGTPKPSPTCPQPYQNFFNLMMPIATALAAEWDTSANFILALSAYESGWDPVYSGPTHTKPINNPFGLTQGGGDDMSFQTLQDAEAYWSSNDGKYVQGATTINQFATDLQPHYNTSPAWVGTLVKVYDSVLTREKDCVHP